VGEFVAACTIALVGHETGVERKHPRRRLGRLLGIAIDGAHLVLGPRRAGHGVDELRTLRLQRAQPLRVRLLPEGCTGALESWEYPSRIEPGAGVIRVRRLGVLNALLRRLGLALELGKIPIER